MSELTTITIEDISSDEIYHEKKALSCFRCFSDPYKIAECFEWKDISSIVNRNIRMAKNAIEWISYSLTDSCDKEESIRYYENIVDWLTKIKVYYLMPKDVKTDLFTKDQILFARSKPIKELLPQDSIPLNNKKYVSCPFHTDKTPSMIINKENTAKCFSCGFFGDTIELVKKLHNTDFKTAIFYILNH